MKILALETSTHACSVALLEGSQQDFSCIERFEIAPRQHTRLILPMIDSVLEEAGYDISHIDVLAFGRGPGAFTGVRVATGVIQAIAYGADLPVAQVSSLAAIAQSYYAKENVERVLVANDARMDEIYFAAYEKAGNFMNLLGDEKVIKPEQLYDFMKHQMPEIKVEPGWHGVGNGWQVYEQQIQSVVVHYGIISSQQQGYELPRAREIAFLALDEITNNQLIPAEQVSPVYLRDDVAKKPSVSTSMV